MKKTGNKSNLRISYISLFVLLFIGIILFTLVISVYLRLYFSGQMSSGESGGQKKYSRHLMMIVDNSTDDFWQSVYEGALSEGDENDIYIELADKGMDADYGTAELLKIAISANVDGILIEPDGTKEVDELINKATKQGIPVVTLLKDAQNTARISYVGISYYNLGQQYAEQIINVIRAKRDLSANGYDTSVANGCEVMVLIDEDLNDSSRSIIYSTIQDVIRNRQDIKSRVSFKEVLIGEGSSFEVEENIRNIFLSEENLPNIIVCLDEICSECVYQALVDYNQVGNVELVAYYTGDSILSGIKKDIVFSTSGVDAKQIGGNAVLALSEYFDSGYASEYYSVDTFVVNRSNVSEYMGGANEED